MANPTDLCTLAQAQLWIGNAANATTNIGMLITQCSRQILTALQRPAILPQTYTRLFDGRVGLKRLPIPEWPLISLSALTVDGKAIPAVTSATSCGYVIETVDPGPPGRPATIGLRGYCWSQGDGNVSATYVAGYQTSETQTIPSSGALGAFAPYGAWTTDQGVSYATTGVALTNSGSAAPAVGQYQVDAGGRYTFNAADNAAAVILSYGFIPSDLAGACAMWVSELLAYQGRVGLKSKTLGGQEVMAYDLSAVPSRVMSMIQPYRRVSMF